MEFQEYAALTVQAEYRTKSCAHTADFNYVGADSSVGAVRLHSSASIIAETSHAPSASCKPGC